MASSDAVAVSMRHVPIHVEGQLKPGCVVPPQEVKPHILSFLASIKVYRLGPIEGYAAASTMLGQTLASLVVAELGGGGGVEGDGEHAVSAWRAQPVVHLYAFEEQQHPGGVDFALSDDENGAPTAFSAVNCPSRELHGLWESIYVAAQTKQVLLAMASTSMLFAMRGVDPTLVSGNRLILLHGQPGTGKSTLARGLAQKLAIRHAEAFVGGVQLLTLNAHALCSKYFAESSMNVGRCFGFIRERVAEEPSTLFVVVIDEVETICSSREAALGRGSNEPSDAVRVVNATLMEIDRLRSFVNVLVLATSNVTGALDSAFLDRCDLRIPVGLASATGRFHIIRSTLVELMRAGVIGPPVSIPPRYELLLHAPGQVSQLLLRLVELSGLGSGGGLSGRALRKLPLQAHALIGDSCPPPVPVGEFLRAMEQAVEALLELRAEGNGGGGGQQQEEGQHDASN